MKNKISMALCLPLLLGVVSCSNNSDGSKSAPIYGPIAESNGNYTAIAAGTMEYIVDERYGENEPFINVYSPLYFCYSQDVLGDPLSTELETVSSVGENEVSYKISTRTKDDVTITIDAAEDTITFSDYDAYRSLDSSYYGEIGTVHTVPDQINVTSNATNPTTREAHTFDLSAYNIDIIKKNNKAYMPVAACSYIFTNPCGVYLAWNGTAFYHYNGSEVMFYGEEDEETSFAEHYYNGKLNGATPSQEIATLHGNETMFYLDNFYGFPDSEQLAGKKFSEYLKENYKSTYDLFFSTGKEDSQNGWAYLANQIIGDGHTSTVDGLGTFYASGDFENKVSWSKRDTDRTNIGKTVLDNRKAAWGQTNYQLTTAKMFETYQDMALIRFDEFNIDTEVTSSTQSESFYRQHMAGDLYSQFAYSFMQINKNSEIKKVVIDLSGNVGGAAVSCLEALSFLKDNFSISNYNPLTETIFTTSYKGTLPGRTTSYEGVYEFYVLISGYSFSCGNLFPTICKNNNMATIIGQKSGGGACIVDHLITPDGQWVDFSGLSRLCLTNTKESNDAGIEPDITLELSQFSDMSALRAAIE